MKHDDKDQDKARPRYSIRRPIPIALLSLAAAGVLAQSGSAALIGHWELNDATGTTAVDSSPAGNTGNFFGNPVWDSDSVRASFVTFDGNGDAIDPAVTLPLMTLSNDFTWAFWGKRPNSDQGNSIVIDNRRQAPPPWERGLQPPAVHQVYPKRLYLAQQWCAHGGD